MTWFVGGAVGLVGGAGLVLAILAAPPLRRPSLSDRVAPYLRDTATPSRLLVDGPAGSGLLGRLTGPLVRDAVRMLDRVLGGAASVRRRLAALGSRMSVEQFRAEQVLWSAAGAMIGIGVALVSIVTGHRSPILLIVAVLGCAAAGVVARDWWLSQAVSRRNAEILAEFPVVAEMLALAVAAGEGLAGAIGRVCRLTHGHLADRLRSILADAHAGASLHQALVSARNDTQLEPLARFLDGMAVALERGTPLAEVLHAQAADVRALGKRQLLESGGKKEIAMMIPVVFIVMPITILFAFFPGIIAITTVAR